MILFGDIVEIVALPPFRLFWSCALLLEFGNGGRIRRIFIAVNDARGDGMVGVQRFGQKPLSGLGISLGREQKV